MKLKTTVNFTLTKEEKATLKASEDILLKLYFADERTGGFLFKAVKEKMKSYGPLSTSESLPKMLRAIRLFALNEEESEE